ncbi:MAG: PDZ domain-containing protein [Verrucomicrobiaceae bacterium]|nr:PDZ domain-containing protein [Verrucomicrobiaceae bacterium]
MLYQPSFITHIALLFLTFTQAFSADPETAEKPDRSLERYTPTVQLIERCMPAVASIQTFMQSGTPGVFNVGVGSASVVHPAGYLITNHHVVNGIVNGNVIFPGMQPMPFKVIAGMSSEDMALIKVEAGTKLPVLPIGRSDDLMLGEPVLVIGNPVGLNHSVSTGIISGLNRSAATGGAFLPWLVQTSAAVSGGNSGGPLINALGKQIGIITSKRLDSENINFAIAADRIREVFSRLISAELRYGFRLGIEIDMYEMNAKVKSVVADSPGSKSGIRPGDVITKFGNLVVTSGFDFHIALIDRKPGEKPEVQLQRGEEHITLHPEIGILKVSDPVADEGMIPGIRFAGYTGTWNRLPDFDQLTPVAEGRADTPTESAFMTEDKENYGLRFSGFIKVPTEGLYVFSTTSDDGSRLSIGKEVIVNNDGLHGVMSNSGLIRLKAGLHPVTVTFFEQGGAEKLEVSYEGPGIKKQVIPKEAYFMRGEHKDE